MLPEVEDNNLNVFLESLAKVLKVGITEILIDRIFTINVETEVRKHPAVVECGKSLHHQGQEPLHQRGAPINNEPSQFPLFRQIGKSLNLYGL